MKENYKIGQINYSVQFKEFVIIEEEAFYQGSCDYEKCEITILERLDETRQEQVLAHELVHALLFEAGFNQEHDEDMVQRLGIVLHQFLNDNYGGI